MLFSIFASLARVAPTRSAASSQGIGPVKSGAISSKASMAPLQLDGGFSQHFQFARNRGWNGKLGQITHLKIHRRIDRTEQAVDGRRVEQREHSRNVIGKEGRAGHIEDGAPFQAAGGRNARW